MRGVLLVLLAAAAAGERVDERTLMVEAQIAHPHDGRAPVRDGKVLEAMRAVPRHAFCPPVVRARAYADSPLPIGEGQTISQPYIVAVMTELLALEPDSKVLEIGTGSGYQAAVLASLTKHVYTIEILKPLQERASKALREQGFSTVQTRLSDGYYGWPEAGPFDAIIVTAAAGHLPPPLWAQLKPGGRMVIPIGSPYEVQRLVVEPVALLGQADALLADEDLLAEGKRSGDLVRVPRGPDLDHVFRAYRLMSASSCARSRY